MRAQAARLGVALAHPAHVGRASAADLLHTPPRPERPEMTYIATHLPLLAVEAFWLVACVRAARSERPTYRTGRKS